MTSSDPETPEAVLIVDGNNVMGAVPDGWWRNRPAAIRRLHARLACHQSQAIHQGQAAQRVLLVLDVPQPDLPAGVHDNVEVQYPQRRGRDAADDRIIEILNELDGADTTVITSDRALADRARAFGAAVVGARSFLGQLGATGC